MITHPCSQKVLAEKVEWMLTSKDRTIGLLKYSEAPRNFAAIFKLPFAGFFPLVHTIGMKFPIDVLFCDRNKKILSKSLAVKPGRLVFPWKYFLSGCTYLLEFSGCSIADLREGDLLEWKDAV